MSITEKDTDFPESKGLRSVAKVKLIVLMHDPSVWNDDVEVLEHEFFDLGFSNFIHNRRYDVTENFLEYFLDDLGDIQKVIEKNGHTETGIYEIIGDYHEKWTDYSNYWSSEDWDWDYEAYIFNEKTKRYDDKEIKDYLFYLYEYGDDRERAMDIIYDFGLENEISTERKRNFKYTNYLWKNSGRIQ